MVIPKHYAGNYRLIAILPSLSKIFENVMYIHLSNFMLSNNFISSCQHGFVEGESTTTALTDIIDNILRNLKAQKYLSFSRF